MDQQLLLSQGIGALGLAEVVDAAKQQKLLEYLRLLDRWNSKFNLTAIRSIDEMVERHLLDSLAGIPWLEGEQVVDVGSGAGLPGIPLAIAEPQRSIVMLDSAQKKTRFIQQAIAHLALANAEVVHSRVEEAQGLKADTLVARAFSAPLDILQSCGHLCADGGAVVLYMGHIGSKLDDIPAHFQLESVNPVDLPGSDVTRHLVVARKLAVGSGP